MVFMLATPQMTFAQRLPTQADFDALVWQTYPAKGQVGVVATVSLENNLYFLDEDSTRRFLVLNGNPAVDDTYTLAPEKAEWFAVFSFEQSGYVADNDEIDADQLLDTLKQQSAAAQDERRSQGLGDLILDGWAVPPHYDTETNLLEWGTKIHDETGMEFVNYTTRILGRNGVMSATLVTDPINLNAHVADFHQALKGFDFLPGEKYAEYRQGDRLAEFGLAALIVGGAAAAAGKTGLLKTIGLALFAGFAVVASGVGAVYRRVFKRTPKV